MRIALLSAVESLSDKDGLPRAYARIGGRSVLERQLDFAIAMGCEQVACLSATLPPELIDVQHVAETKGLKFQVIRDARPLSGLVCGSDEILVIGDGLLFDESGAAETLGDGRTVLTFPAEDAVPAGFERLDSEHAWAGIFLGKGSLVEQLPDLPADIDPQSTLLRLALQSGTKTVRLPASALTDYEWTIADSIEKKSLFENIWLEKRARNASFFAPIAAVADRTALTIVKRHDNPAKAARTISGVSYALLMVAVLSGYLGFGAAGFLITALAAFAARFVATIFTVTHRRDDVRKGVKILAVLPPAMVDLTLIALVTFSVSRDLVISALFAVLMLVGLLRVAVVVAGGAGASKLQDALEDRAMHAFLLAAAFALGQLVAATQIFAVALLGWVLVQTYLARLTRA